MNMSRDVCRPDRQSFQRFPQKKHVQNMSEFTLHQQGLLHNSVSALKSKDCPLKVIVFVFQI